MKPYEFTIISSGLDPAAEDFEDRLFKAGCDDATVAFVNGLTVLEFERSARNFTHALISAVKDVKRAGATVEHVEPDYLVSLSDIAERCKITRAAVSHFVKGTRGDSFPKPIARLTTERPLWDWVQVSQWMFRRGSVPLDAVIQAKIVRETNRTMRAARERKSIFSNRLSRALAA